MTVPVPEPRQLSFATSDEVWLVVRDGNPTAKAIFDQHYSRRHYRDGRSQVCFAGPGERLVLVTHDALALFLWRKFFPMDKTQTGVNCAVFRNEGPVLSSTLVREAMRMAKERWPDERRYYTWVNPKKIRSKNPGCCFLKAGWKHAGWTKRGLRILVWEEAA